MKKLLRVKNPQIKSKLQHSHPLVPDYEIYLPTTPQKLFHKHCPSHKCQQHERASGLAQPPGTIDQTYYQKFPITHPTKKLFL